MMSGSSRLLILLLAALASATVDAKSHKYKDYTIHVVFSNHLVSHAPSPSKRDRVLADAAYATVRLTESARGRQSVIITSYFILGGRQRCGAAHQMPSTAQRR